ncbi:MAG: PAS domain S-box protein [Ignavibacteriales bacterium]|nr:PAS domain S-box protein [Ignavibacteriales bacterium]
MSGKNSKGLMKYFLLGIPIVILFITGLSFFKHVISDREREIFQKLLTEADYKTNEINNWYNNTFTKAHSFFDSQEISGNIYDNIQRGISLKDDHGLNYSIKSLIKFSSLTSISIFDVTGTPIFWEPEQTRLLELYQREALQKVIDSRGYFLSDLYFNPVDSSSHFSLYIPLEKVIDGEKQIFAVVMLDADPVSSIFQKIKEVEDESNTSESIIIKNQKELVLSLSNLQLRKGYGFQSVSSLKNIDNPFVSKSKVSFWEGTDYTGREVFGVSKRTAQVPWFFTTQIDKSLVYEPVFGTALLIGLGLFIILITAGLGVYYYLRKVYYGADIVPRHKIENDMFKKRYEALFKYANDIILTTDARGRILEANSKAIETYGFSLDEFKKLTVKQLRSKETVHTFDSDFEKSKTDDGHIYETIHMRKDGTSFPVEVSSRFVVLDNAVYVQGSIRDITERKHAEEKLRQADLLLQLVINGTKDVVFIKNTESQFLLINKVGALQIGRPIEQIIGRTNEELFDKEQAKKFNKNDQKIFTDGAALNFEEEMIINGKKIISSVIITPWKDSKGSIIGLIGVSRDVTEKQEMINALKQNEKMLRTFFDTSAAGISLVGIDGRFVKVNKKICELLGYEEEELYKLNYQQFVYSEDAGRINASLAKLIKGEVDSLTIDGRYVRKDGEVRWATTSVSLVCDNDGNPLYLSGITVDNTEAINAKKDRDESENKYRKIFENVQDVFFITNNDGILLDISPSIQRHAGYTREELIQKHVEGFYLNKDDRKEFLTGMQKHGEVIDFETRMKAKDGRIIHTAINAQFRRNDKGEIIGMEGSLRDITERKKAEEAVKESEKKYRKVFENIQDVFFITDNSGIILDISPSIKRYTEYPREEFIGKHVNDFYHDLQDKAEFLNRMKSHGEVSDFEIRMQTKSDAPLYASMNAHNRYNEYGQITGMEGSLRNITERKKAEADLKASERRYRQLFELNPHIMWLYDLKTLKFIAVNEAAIQHYGYSREEFLSMTIKDIRPAEDFSRLADNLKHMPTGIEHSGIWRHIRKDGTIINVDIVSHTIDFSGTHAKLVLITDVTEKLKAQEELLKLSRAVEQTSSSIMITDLKGNIEYVNRAFTKNTGYAFEEVKGKNPRLLKSDETTKEVFEQMWETILAGNEWHGELLNKTKDGRLVWETISINPIIDKNGQIRNFVEIKDDITSQKLLQQELIEAKDKAEHSNKLKTQFLAQMSHEIRTPLNAMLSYSSLIKHELENLEITSGDITESLEGISDSGRRIIRTIELILDISDMQTGRYEAIPKKISLHKDVLHKLYAEYKSLAEAKNIEFKIEKNIDNEIINSDEYSLTKIFDHLIDNAIKFTNKGFVKINISMNGSEKNILVAVKDSGIGISKEYLPELFTSFSQEEQGYSRSFDGNGLGLALVKKYCELNKIKIDVESKKGTGTTFLLTIPYNR